ncbi:nuclear receptor coactivator 6-like [Biomphalaria glabrata]|uniref:Nuclear receptor coactivator 6-like n=1 Tax=Biomphalaria glabrata TaxID=6526 RepID=A0A9W3AZ12_BIOGL|nr:nuclear receptor coactivator 6-like [Biomphalaria glabrata]XP_055892457.1 nuclear receptor coactivator 6-like [Biomphalaria glabrata]XP_055892458.1 nuclear receptor coactivator 6-like [Biomphalaria glabrata]
MSDVPPQQPPPAYAPPTPHYPAYPPNYYPPPQPQPQIIMIQQQQQQQQQQNVNVTVDRRNDVVVVKREVNHCLHCIISLFFWPWIFVWIALCICDDM